MQKFNIAVIGGGAAGIMAAISAGRNGRAVIICEKMPSLGKKILVSGGGRCNISNDDLGESHYNPEAQEIVRAVFSRFGRDSIEKFFNELGLKLYSQEGRIFPVTNQASSVLKVMEEGLKNLKVPMEFGFEVDSISSSASGFTVRSRAGKSISCSSVIITGGGKTYPSLGSDGSCYSFAGMFGHKIIKPVPSAVPLLSKDRLCHLLQGQRIQCIARSMIDRKIRKEANGELLFTKYGLSGTAILDISEDISIAINRMNLAGPQVSIDMAPFISHNELRKEISSRISRYFAPENMTMGVLPNKFGLALKESFKNKGADEIAGAIKDKRFEITGTRGWNEAEFTSGGVDIRSVNSVTLESKLKDGIYFAGEILDVNGERGGYNLAWAWASGFVAGLTE